MKKTHAIGVALGALIITLPLIVAAGNARLARYTLAQDQVHEGNMYAAGEDVSVAGTVVGDVVAAGSRIVVSGVVEDDVLAAGGQTHISGIVHGDVRLGTGDALILGDVGGDLAVAAGKLVAPAGSVVGGDIRAAGGQTILEGDVYGSVYVSSGEVVIDGAVAGNVDVRGGKLTIGDNAYVQGTLSFRGPRAPFIASGAVIEGGTRYTQDDFGGREFGYFAHGVGAAATALWIVMSLVASLIFFGLFRKHALAAHDAALAAFWPQTGRGILALIVVPIVCVLLFATVIGIPLGMFGLLAFGVLAAITCALSSIVFGTVVARYVFKKEHYQPTYTSVIWGNIGLRFVGLIPVVGWVICLIFFSVSFGALTHAAYRHYWLNR